MESTGRDPETENDEKKRLGGADGLDHVHEPEHEHEAPAGPKRVWITPKVKRILVGLIGSGIAVSELLVIITFINYFFAA